MFKSLIASKWTQAAEKLLLAKHKDIEESKLPIKNKWKKISEDMHCHNYDFTPEQCRLKIKAIKEKYERNKRKNNKSGESPADSDNEELEEIFEKLPDMNPVCLIESKPAKSPSPDLENCKRKGTSSPLLDGTDADEGKLNKRARRSVDLMKSFFKETMEKREEAVERRHKEKIDTINSLVGVLKDLVKK